MSTDVVSTYGMSGVPCSAFEIALLKDKGSANANAICFLNECHHGLCGYGYMVLLYVRVDSSVAMKGNSRVSVLWIRERRRDGNS